MEQEVYDKIYVGSGPIMMLDALNSNFKSQKVLIIDKDKVLGGAWKNLDIFGCKNLENAVHYLLPNKTGYEFLEKTFNIELEDNRRKYYAISFFGKKFLISVRNIIGRILYSINGGDHRDYFNFLMFLKNCISKSHVYSTKYPKNGICEIVEKIKKVVLNSSIKISLNEEIIRINTFENKVFLETNIKKYVAQNMFISHGFIPPNEFFINNKKILINLQKYPRPSLHINTLSNEEIKKVSIPFKFSQALFPKGSIIKYVHQISQFIEFNNEKKSQHIVVASIRPDLKNSFESYIKIARELEDYGLIPKVKNRLLKDFFWQDILLPQLNNSDLDYISRESNYVIKNFKTECFNTALGKYSQIWKFEKNLFK